MGNTKKKSSKKNGVANLRIGELVKSLKKEFSNISVSKVRYLEDKGLINPERDSSGYRRYGETDVKQLRNILSTQRDEHLPLEVIAQRLKNGSLKSKLPTKKGMFISNVETENHLTEKDLLKLSKITPGELKSLKAVGIFSPNSKYSKDDLEVINAIKQLIAEGIEPRHLKFFKRAAEQEANLILQSIIPLFLKTDKKGAYTKLDDLASAGKEVRTALLKKEIRSALN